MNTRRRGGAAIACMAALIAMAGCGHGLPRTLHREAAFEQDRLRDAEQQLKQTRRRLKEDESTAPDLFADSRAREEWDRKLAQSQNKLDDAERDGRELRKLLDRDRANSGGRADQLLGEERRLREQALADARGVDETAAKWLDFRRDAPGFVAQMSRKHEALKAVDFAPLEKTVGKAEQDWPAKKDVLTRRLDALKDEQKNADTAWQATETQRQDAAQGKISGAAVGTLVAEDEALDAQQRQLTSAGQELTGECGQLYNTWDKILTDLDESRFGDGMLYRERVNTITTHFTDVAAKQTETHNEERWTDVPEMAYRSVENDVGMAVGHKDAGLFDSEAQTMPQPAGFAYVASPEQGSNQYGYWSHGGGESVWTFLPQYLILRELLWHHDYRPVVLGEYNGYRMAQRSGMSYYGRETPTAAPKYGTHGTFTQSRYASSRYVQSGGFKGSAYASHPSESHAGNPGASIFGKADEEPHASMPEGRAGHRFGAGASPSSGQRFGRSPGAFRSPGRSFGRRR